MGPTRPSELLRELHRVLSSHPDARVAAIGPDGVFRDIPDEVRMGPGHRRLGGRSVFDHIDPVSAGRVIAGWQRVRETGASSGALTGTDGRAVTTHTFDLTGTLGVVVMVWLGDLVVDEHSDGSEEVELSSRFGRYRRDVLATVIDADRDAVALLGWRPEELANRSPLDLIHPDDRENANANWMMVLTSSGVPQRWRGRHERSDGSHLWLEITNTNRLEDPDHGDVLSEMMDVSEEMATAEALRKREELLLRLTEALPVGVAHVDGDGVIEHRNDELGRITGDRGAGTLGELLGAVVEADRERVDEAIAAVLGPGRSAELEVRLRPNGSYLERVCQLTLRALHDAAGGVEGAVVCMADVTESTQMRQELEVRATFDQLTACYNRASTMAALERWLAARRRPGSGTAVVFIDLDGFKAVNDRLGHAAGDELLVAVAERLRTAVRGDDIVGRLGGDEFLVVCPTVSGPGEAVEIAVRLVAGLGDPVTLAGEEVRPAASVGVAWTAADDATADSLVAAADEAMYRSKQEGACRPALAAA